LLDLTNSHTEPRAEIFNTKKKKQGSTYEKNKDGGAPLDLPWWD
jgi:hypothetical protein